MIPFAPFSSAIFAFSKKEQFPQHAKIKNIMKDFFTEKNIEYMFHANKAGALIDFYYKSYANFG